MHLRSSHKQGIAAKMELQVDEAMVFTWSCFWSLERHSDSTFRCQVGVFLFVCLLVATIYDV